jgi:hypothetical protein
MMTSGVAVLALVALVPGRLQALPSARTAEDPGAPAPDQSLSAGLPLDVPGPGVLQRGGSGPSDSGSPTRGPFEATVPEGGGGDHGPACGPLALCGVPSLAAGNPPATPSCPRAPPGSLAGE